MAGGLVLFILFFVLGPLWAQAKESQSVWTLPPVVVEGEAILTEEAVMEEIDEMLWSPAAKNLISVTTGMGSKRIDFEYNELGIPYLDMNKEGDITLDRKRQSSWLLQHKREHGFFGEAPPSKVIRQVHLQPSFENFNLRGRVISMDPSRIRGIHRYQIEAGTHRDRRLFRYQNPGLDPFNPSSGGLETFQNQEDQSFATLSLSTKKGDGLFDWDSVDKDVHLGSERVGHSKINQVGLGLRASPHSEIEWSSFLRAKQGRFESKKEIHESHLSQGQQWGVLVRQKFQAIADSKQRPAESFLDVGFSHESLSRDYNDQSQIYFDRYGLDLAGTHQKYWDSFSVKGHLRTQGAADSTRKSVSGWNSSLNQVQFQKGRQELRGPIALDLGAEISTLPQQEHQWNLGFKGQARRYSLLPTPLQKMGDGMSLVGNEALPLEEGLRVASGLWFEAQEWQMEVLPFYEQTFNEPMIVAVSPQSAKTVGLGSVDVRGVEFNLQKNWTHWEWVFIYSYQEALNSSKISWQRGQALPGRPMHTLQSSLTYRQKKGVHFGFHYGFKSEEALDLSGLWKRSPYHDLRASLGYETEAWALQLVGSQLLSSLNSTPLSLQQGMAGYDLTDPKIETQDYQLLCEIFL